MRITRIYEERLTRRFCATNLSQSPDRVQLAATSPENLKTLTLATQTPRDLLEPRNLSLLHQTSFPVISSTCCYLSFSVIYYVTPRGHQKTLETLHTLRRQNPNGAGGGI